MKFVSGEGEVIASIHAFKTYTQHSIMAATEKATLDLVAEAKRQITSMHAVDTGRLLNSVGVVELSPGLHYVVGPNTPYDICVHYGTRRMPGRPYLANAAANIMPAYYMALEAITGCRIHSM